MKIEIWSDYVCPFCYIGKRQLEEALSQFPHKDKVTIEFKSYELRPDIPIDTGKSMAEMLAEKFNSSIEDAEERLAGISSRAEQAGLKFDFINMIPTNTFDAHRLTKFAETKGKDAELVELILAAYFKQAKHIGETDTLLNLGVEAGLAEAEVSEVLRDKTAFADEVRHDQQEARRIGVRGVPFFLIDGNHTIAGSQSPEKFLEYLQKFWDEKSTSQAGRSVTENIDGDGCVDGNCEIPTK